MSRRISLLLVGATFLLASCATFPTAYRFEPVAAPATADSAATDKNQFRIRDDSLSITIAFDRIDEPNFVFDVGIENRAQTPLLVVPEFFYYVAPEEPEKRFYYARSADDIIKDIDAALEEIKADAKAAQKTRTAYAVRFAEELKEDLLRLTELRAEVEKNALRETRLLTQEKTFGKIYFPSSMDAEKIELLMLVGARRHRAVFERKEDLAPMFPASVARPSKRR